MKNNMKYIILVSIFVVCNLYKLVHTFKYFGPVQYYHRSCSIAATPENRFRTAVPATVTRW